MSNTVHFLSNAATIKGLKKNPEKTMFEKQKLKQNRITEILLAFMIMYLFSPRIVSPFHLNPFSKPTIMCDRGQKGQLDYFQAVMRQRQGDNLCKKKNA